MSYITSWPTHVAPDAIRLAKYHQRPQHTSGRRLQHTSKDNGNRVNNNSHRAHLCQRFRVAERERRYHHTVFPSTNELLGMLSEEGFARAFHVTHPQYHGSLIVAVRSTIPGGRSTIAGASHPNLMAYILSSHSLQSPTVRVPS